MGRLFVVELEGRAYRCKFCKTHLALADDLVSRLWYMACNVGQTHSSSINTQSDAQLSASVPLCSVLSKVSMMESAQEKSQKYKEGKFVLERGRILDGVDSEFYIDTRPSLSDAEDP
ncbi:hypothetical protein RHGRI_018391 [Rhododendron griersonianum]|uniref:Yippee domain-containing protein n=1 Tax=Rhododendron griersonianum TaxID=479676 RepID=A0AAV6K1D4_9ERIC|nr:hypothetical protein RHGRI_018391 [Rhododendron griersonianum]